jgi:hypothetical protein
MHANFFIVMIKIGRVSGAFAYLALTDLSFGSRSRFVADKE